VRPSPRRWGGEGNLEWVRHLAERARLGWRGRPDGPAERHGSRLHPFLHMASARGGRDRRPRVPRMQRSPAWPFSASPPSRRSGRTRTRTSRRRRPARCRRRSRRTAPILSAGCTNIARRGSTRPAPESRSPCWPRSHSCLLAGAMGEGPRKGQIPQAPGLVPLRLRDYDRCRAACRRLGRRGRGVAVVGADAALYRRGCDCPCLRSLLIRQGWDLRRWLKRKLKAPIRLIPVAVCSE
jgi:hypothetical protein